VIIYKTFRPSFLVFHLRKLYRNELAVRFLALRSEEPVPMRMLF